MRPVPGRWPKQMDDWLCLLVTECTPRLNKGGGAFGREASLLEGRALLLLIELRKNLNNWPRLLLQKAVRSAVDCPENK